MEYTVGMFIVTNSKKLLICHPTNHNQDSWSIPKGLMDDDEEPLQAGIRELEEETGMVFNEIVKDVLYIKKVFDVKYPKRSKTLVPYFIVLKNDDVKQHKLKCESMVEIGDREPFPEVDKFMWVTFEDALKVLHVTQVKALNNFIEDEEKWLEL